MPDLDIVSTILKSGSRVIACVGAASGDGTSTAARTLAEALIPCSTSGVLLFHAAPSPAEQTPPENTLAAFSQNPSGPLTPLHLQNGWLTLLTPGTGIGLREFLNREQMARFWHQVRSQFQYAVVDLPGFGANPELAVLAAQSDGVALVLNCRRTRWEVALNLRDRLQAAGATMLGVILNRRNYVIPDSLYRLL